MFRSYLKMVANVAGCSTKAISNNDSEPHIFFHWSWQLPPFLQKLNSVWCNKAISAMETISNDTASTCCCVYSTVTAPAQHHATKPSVYTTLLISILVSTYPHT